MNKQALIKKLHLSFFSIVAGFSLLANAAPPPGYYDTVNTTSPESLHATLHSIIDDHTRFPYTDATTDTWDILESADQDPSNPNNVLDIYKNASYPKQGGGNSFYNREHSWPKSYGFPSDGSSNYPYTDAHHLFISDSSYNSSRSNKPFDNCATNCTQKPTDFNDNRGGTDSQSNWTAGSYTEGKWETWLGRRGEVARALMYMAVRYEGGSHGTTGVNEPDLRLTDDRTLISQSNAGSNIDVAYMGLKSVLLQWHLDDPVDDMERRRNDIIFAHQGNRNPFIDHPEYVVCVFANDCSGLGDGTGDTTPPSAPTALVATGGVAEVSLNWTANNEADLAGYHVYRSDAGQNNFMRLTPSAVTVTSYLDTGLEANTSYDYQITALDTSANQSTPSDIASATTSDAPSGGDFTVWINEFHYDNASSDVGEFFEIAGEAGTDLSGWSVVGYNGNGGSAYKTVNLVGVIPDQSNGFGTLSFAFSGMQNGSPDGLALVDNTGLAIMFISYEGSFTANGGPADGMTSQNIGVSEASSTPVGFSLQLGGQGNQYSDFTWQAAAAETPDAVNNEQVFTAIISQPVAAFTSSCVDLTCTFDASESSAEPSSIAQYNWDFGDSTTSNGVTSNHQFEQAGSYTVTLEVVAEDGGIATLAQVVEVTEPLPPVGYFENIEPLAIPDKKKVSSIINVDYASVETTAVVSVNISHEYRGDISIKLIAPDGSKYKLKRKNRRDDGQNIIETYSVDINCDTVGEWKLKIKDHFRKDTGTLNSWSLQL
ncbi:endonuclease [Aliikangiella sp. IMCC44632]